MEIFCFFAFRLRSMVKLKQTHIAHPQNVSHGLHGSIIDETEKRRLLITSATIIWSEISQARKRFCFLYDEAEKNTHDLFEMFPNKKEESQLTYKCFFRGKQIASVNTTFLLLDHLFEK